ncbi:MAG: hypothetical protein R3B99_08440 [Polyangiales bacterium]
MKRAFVLVRPASTVGSWSGAGDDWDRADQERFETLNPTWRPDL